MALFGSGMVAALSSCIRPAGSVGKNVTIDSPVRIGSWEDIVSAFAIANCVAKEIPNYPPNP
ncbi:MAG: hypothetical protein JWN06_165 [Propionibacteriaceae bacterium]|nr:hypothetical protein [Propionibacteriaceae bacterium]